MAGVVAIVPAYNRADSVGATVRALLGLAQLDRIVVVDDGSSDATADEARRVGAEVLQLPVNRGKGGAIAAAIEVCPDAEVFLLIDADLSSTAAVADALLEPVLHDRADLVVGVLPPPGNRAGFGHVRRVATKGIHRACGLNVTAPLSGQRAVRAEYLRGLRSAERFGLEVGMTIDAVRAGARFVEVPVPMDHRHTGRSLGGFRHRATQGLDIVVALWSRLTSPRFRVVGIVGLTLLILMTLLVSGSSQVSASVAGGGDADQVVLVGVPRLGLDEIGRGRYPTLDRLARDGALAATSVRTGSREPSSAEAYATLGAGTRVTTGVSGELAYPSDAPLEDTTAGEVMRRRTGAAGNEVDTDPGRRAGEVVVPGITGLMRSAGEHLSSGPGALGEVLAENGFKPAVVSNADIVQPDGTTTVRRPAAMAVVDEQGSVPHGEVSPEGLLVDDPNEPFGQRASIKGYLDETAEALAESDFVTVDLGDTDRAAAYSGLSSPELAIPARERAIARTDSYLQQLLPTLEDHTLLLVVGLTPPTSEWALTPTIAYGAGVVPGSLHSTVTKREGLITLTDITPTVLDWLDVKQPAGMIGRSLRFHPEPPNITSLNELNEHAQSREEAYFPAALTFIWVQALVYVLAGVMFSQGHTPRAGSVLRWVVCSCAAWPMATFIERAVPGIESYSANWRQVVVWSIAAAVAFLATRVKRGGPLTPLAWIAGATVVVLVADVAMGAELQMASLLGYSPHTAARYIGFGNVAFAVLAACAVVFAAVHVAGAPRRNEAVLTVGGLLAVVLVADVWPTLGADVGGILTMVPVFGLLLYAMSGRRLSWRPVLLMGLLTVAVLAAVTAIDLASSADSQGHLGRYVGSSSSADGNFMTTIQRKWAVNMSLLGDTIWTWMVPITAAFMLYMLVFARGWERLLPARSTLRMGAVATVAAGLLGWLVNDSGVVVSALVFVFVGPYLTLLALHRGKGSPVLLPPLPQAGEVPNAAVAAAH